jgi:hypothetical protein
MATESDCAWVHLNPVAGAHDQLEVHLGRAQATAVKAGPDAAKPWRHGRAGPQIRVLPHICQAGPLSRALDER